MENEQERKRRERREELLTRFFSILLTAVVSALITFLQTLVVPEADIVMGSDDVANSAVLGGALRTALEGLKIKKFL